MINRDVKNIIAGHVKRNCLAHAYLFLYHIQDVRERIAEDIIRLLLCTKRNTETQSSACGKCIECVGYEKNPNLFILNVREEDGKNIIGISAVRRIRDFVYLSRALRWNIVYIPSAERLTREATGAILKILEEPPPGTVFILLAPEATLVSPVLRSRVITLRHLDEEDVQRAAQAAKSFFSSPAHERLTQAKLLSEDVSAANILLRELAIFFETELKKSVSEKEMSREWFFNTGKQLRQVCETMHLLNTTNTNSRLLLEQLFISL